MLTVKFRKLQAVILKCENNNSKSKKLNFKISKLKMSQIFNLMINKIYNNRNSK